MRKKYRANTLFYAENNSLIHVSSIGFMWLVALAIGYFKSRQNLVSSADLLGVVGLGAIATFVAWIAARHQIIFTSDHLCSVIGAFRKRVFYDNIREIALKDLGGEQVFLTFELHKDRYSPVRDVLIPRANCREILQLLSSQVPQARWDDLARQWRDNTTE